MKKVFFILDWDFAYILSPIANELIRENIIDNNVACLNVGRNYYHYLKTDKIKHPFKRIYSLDEVYETKIYKQNFFSKKEKEIIKEKVFKLEKKYKKYGSLWQFVWADRNHIKESYYDILWKLIVFFEFFEGLYSKEMPDAIITNAYASMPHLISYVVATELNIKVIAPELVRVDKKTFLTTNKYKLLDNIEIPTNELDKYKLQSKKLLDNYKDFFDKPFYEKINEKRKKDMFQGVKRFLNYSYNYYITKLYSGHTKPNPFKKLFVYEFMPRVKKIYFNKFYEFKKNYTELQKFIYFPLHLQPEATTMTNAPMYLNQLFVIETLSKSIPIDYKLYVKEHPNMFGNNNKYFYNQIKNLPNVELFHPSVNSKEMIKKSQAVVTITGTVGLEALILGKPVFTIGEVFYNECSLVKQLKDIPITKWHDEIISMLEDYSYDEDVLIEFLSKVVSQSYDMLFTEPGYFDEAMEEENMKTLIKAIKEKL